MDWQRPTLVFCFFLFLLSLLSLFFIWLFVSGSLCLFCCSVIGLPIFFLFFCVLFVRFILYLFVSSFMLFLLSKKGGKGGRRTMRMRGVEEKENEGEAGREKKWER